jgi:hypothetical protein
MEPDHLTHVGKMIHAKEQFADVGTMLLHHLEDYRDFR